MAVKVFIFALLVCGVAALYEPISETHRSAAIELFVSKRDGSYGSLEESYQAIRSFDVLGIEVQDSPDTCFMAFQSQKASSATVKDIFYALKITEILKCSHDEPDHVGAILSRLQSSLKVANSLRDYYYAIGSLVSIKNQEWISQSSTILEDASNIFDSIKTLSQSDGTWRYASSEGESSPNAAGLALESLAGVLSLAGSQIESSKIGSIKNDIIKLFDGLEGYEDGSLYFEEKPVDASSGTGGSLLATCSVVRGVTAFAAVIEDKINIPEDKVVGIAKFFLSIGVPGSSTEMYHQLDALGHLEKNSVTIPLVLSTTATTLSLTSGDLLKVRVSTVLGSATPPMEVNLVRVVKSNSKDAPIIHDQKLDFNQESSDYTLDILSKSVDVGKYSLTFEVFPHDAEHVKTYSAGGQVQALIAVTGIIQISNAEIAVLDTDTGSTETVKKLDMTKEETVSLAANHLQRLQFSLLMTSPSGGSFKPHQVFLRLRHESKVEHMFLLKRSGKKFDLVLDFLGLVEKFYYLSGVYTIELAVGDSTMENSFLKSLVTLELDLPEAPENAARPRPVAADVASRFAPKPEITHIFRVPEKRPPPQLSYAFLVLTLLPLLGFLIALWSLGANLKNFPGTGLPLVSAILFHGGILAVLVLYALFWIKLNLFTTLKYLGFLCIFLVVVGHNILSHLAYISSKAKTN
ncbi:dolichyl-diphosphooligosaccharide--protein glycosyltransferase subunit 2 [Cryptomeria japonica]|uniref:dolichyl-diphosphooligosaccharide--protein glycosyltransferase subunit 2 n=1 Tax=Cryptomeria japonica TaxID=3369 RepID=UPI0025ABF8E2|nr:dolichyl-diphosphooligosaccharide--protein glycosyltransferase subunit 2 [Cryptomeria japonica]